MADGLAVPARSDAVRIVPLHPGAGQRPVEGEAAAGSPPHLTYHGGRLLSSVAVFSLFWGPAWSDPSAAATAGQLNAFFDAILTGPLMDQLGEYSVPGATIGHGSRIGTATVAAPALGASVSDGAVQHFLQAQVGADPAIPRPTPDTLYFLYLPPGVSVAQGGARSCQAFCGYHNDIAGRLFYAVMPYPDCTGCRGGLSLIDALTSTSSHELCEAITDPVPGEGWYDDANNAEIGDLCAWRTKQVAGLTVQREWSNKANACI